MVVAKGRRWRVLASVTLGAALLLLGLVLYGRGTLTPRASVRPPGRFGVGLAILPPREGGMALFYPAGPREREVRVRHEGAYLGFVAPEAPQAVLPARPLVVLVHGYTASRLELAWLGERLAADGYVAAATDHADEGEPMDAAHACARARDVTRIIDAVAAHVLAGRMARTDRVLVVGHSFGGTTALALAGTPLRARPPCPDPRVAAVVLTAPPVAPFDLGSRAAPREMPRLALPPAVFVGGGDSLRASAERVGRAYPGARVEVIPGAEHLVFKGVCTPYAKLRMSAQCEDPSGVDRVAVHEAVFEACRAALVAIEAGR